MSEAAAEKVAAKPTKGSPSLRKGDRVAVEGVRYAACFNRVLDHNVIPAYEPESKDEIPRS